MARTHAANIKQWEQLTASVAANAAELPQLELQRAALEKVLEEVLALLTQQAQQRASKQQSSQRLQTLMVEGERLETVLKVSLKQHYGPRNEKLAEFGLLPFRGRKRKAAEEPTPPPEVTPETPDPSTGSSSKSAE